jgi:hypothetical protein
MDAIERDGHGMKKPPAILFLILLVTAWSRAGNPVADAVKSVALLETTGGTCTAFSPAPSIWVTKFHCADDDYKFRIRGETAEFIREDRNLDLLLLRGALVPAIKIAKEESELGDPLVMLGWPSGWDDSVPYISYGHMSALGLWRNSTSSQRSRAKVNAVDGTSYFGMSGGPAINSNGEVVGVINSISLTPPIPIAYITPLKELRKFLGLTEAK